MNDKLTITIRIANQTPIKLTIDRDEEEIIRLAESNVNRLWNSWSERYNASSDALLAMVAFQFAKLHATKSRQLDNAIELLKAMDKDMDRLLAVAPPVANDNEAR